MINNLYIESKFINHPRVEHIKKSIKYKQIFKIDKIENYWGKVKRPYLLKRDELNLYIGEKKGNLVKQAPDAYGLEGDLHYYYIHSYNCIYECNYCYLQGYFQTPDLVMFINHEDIIAKMEEIIKNTSKTVWFHAGEFSDSLALSHVSNELDLYFNFFKKYKSAKLELRTKSVNISTLKKLSPLDNVIVSYSLSPDDVLKNNDLKAPGLKARINAINELSRLGFKIGIHLDPIVYSETFQDDYQELISNLPNDIEYISVGVVRFTKDVYRQVLMNYPNAHILKGELVKSFDGKIRYPRPMRLWILNKVKSLLLEKGYRDKSIYLCME